MRITITVSEYVPPWCKEEVTITRSFDEAEVKIMCSNPGEAGDGALMADVILGLMNSVNGAVRDKINAQ